MFLVKISSIMNVFSVFLKIFLAIMIFTAVYSLIYVNINIEEAEYGIDENFNMYVKGTITIQNAGFYEFDDLDITLIFQNQYENETFAQVSQTLGKVPADPSLQYKSFNLQVPLSQLLSHEQLIYSDTLIYMVLEIEGEYALGLIPFGITIKQPFKWEAPLEQLKIDLTVRNYNSTHKSVVINYDFYSPKLYAYQLNITYYYVEDSKETYVNTVSIYVPQDKHISDHTLPFIVPADSSIKVVFSFLGFTYEVLLEVG